MQLTFDALRYKHGVTGRFHRAALWLAVLVFAAQLFGMAFHHHDLTEQSDDCVSCHLWAQLPSGMPQAPAEVLIALAVAAYRITLQPIYYFIAEQIGYLLPLPQAPPRFSSSF